MSTAIVIGSGIGGLSAAKTLVQNGYQVTVLQAGDVIGGRLHTRDVPMGGKSFAFDYGASWMHGSCEENPVTQLSLSVPNLVTVQTDDESMEIYNSKGQEISEEESDKVFEKYSELRDQMEEKGKAGESEEQAFNRLAPGMTSNPLFMYHVANDVEFQTSGSIKDLSATLGADDDQFEGTQMLIVSGYQKFPQTLIDTHNLQVLTKHKVTEVNYNQSQEVSTVVCENGKTFTAGYVVVAVPLGVLKKKTIKFTPQLAQRKRQAIQGLAFGNVCKVLVVFNGKFPITTKSHYIGTVADNVNERGMFTYFMNVWALSGGLPALMTFGLGGNADQVQSMPQQQAKDLIAKHINTFAQTQITPKDFSIVRTSWRSNPNSWGAYPYSGVNTKPDDWQEICRPMFNEGWYFCGDHTTRRYRGTVHGAIISGEEAGFNIVNQVAEADWEYFDLYGEGVSEEEGEEEEKKEEEGKQEEEEKEEEKEEEDPPEAMARLPAKKAQNASSKGVKTTKWQAKGVYKKRVPLAAAGARNQTTSTAPVVKAEGAQCCKLM